MPKIKFLVFFITLVFISCSEDIDRKDYMDKVKDLKLDRSKFSRALQEPGNKDDINVQLLTLQKSVSELPEVSGWDKDDSLKIYFTEAIDNDLSFYNKTRNRLPPSTLHDSVYQKMDDVKHMEKSLSYDLLILQIILDQERALENEAGNK